MELYIQRRKWRKTGIASEFSILWKEDWGFSIPLTAHKFNIAAFRTEKLLLWKTDVQPLSVFQLSITYNKETNVYFLLLLTLSLSPGFSNLQPKPGLVWLSIRTKEHKMLHHHYTKRMHHIVTSPLKKNSKQL